MLMLWAWVKEKTMVPEPKALWSNQISGEWFTQCIHVPDYVFPFFFICLIFNRPVYSWTECMVDFYHFSHNRNKSLFLNKSLSDSIWWWLSPEPFTVPTFHGCNFVVTHSINASTWEPETGKFLWFPEQPGYVERPCLKQQNKQTNKISLWTDLTIQRKHFSMGSHWNLGCLNSTLAPP